MGLVHTPRVFMSIAKGLYRRRGATTGHQPRQQNPSHMVGMSYQNPHIYQARAGIFDVDHLGHLNNASYLNHAELARWQMTAENGMLSTMFQNNMTFLVTSVALRYRKEIKPLFRQFQIHSSVVKLDERNIYVYQTFRHSHRSDNKIKAQLLLQGVAFQMGKGKGGGGVLDPRDFLKTTIGADPTLVDELSSSPGPEEDHDNKNLYNMIEHYEELETSFRNAAANDDASH